MILHNKTIWKIWKTENDRDFKINKKIENFKPTLGKQFQWAALKLRFEILRWKT